MRLAALAVASPVSSGKASRQRGAAAADAAAADAAAAAKNDAAAAACESAHYALRASAAESVSVQLELIAQNERLRGEVELLQEAANNVNAAGGGTTTTGRAKELELIAQVSPLPSPLPLP